jgi:hypothetical protein
MSSEERKRLVAERCRRSVVWRVVHMLGSLQLALVLLATIAIACAVATFAESGFSAKIAQAYIYKAPWFIVWLGVLCVNLLAVTATRWPWEKRHTGFIVTHFGIVTLLAGAMIGLRTGFEGNVTLRRDAPPVSRVTTSRSIIQIESPADTFLYVKPFDAEIARPSRERPRVFQVPGTALRIVADEYAPSLVDKPVLVPSMEPGAAPGVVLRFRSAALEHDIAVPLLLQDSGPAEEDFFGLATIRLQREPPPAVTDAGPAESRMVFARFAPVSDVGGPSGVDVRLGADGETVTLLDAGGTGVTYARKEIMGRPVSHAGATVTVENFWPDFVMRDGRPDSVSESPNNPAALVRIRPAPAAGDTRPALVVVAGDDVAYWLLRGGEILRSGRGGVGDEFVTGWSDWRAEVVAVSESAVLARETRPGPPPGDASPRPGFRARLESSGGPPGPPRWIESGRVTTLTDGTHVVRMGYGLETRPLPFTLRLVDFQVPRDEGTDTPSDFRATVEFHDPKTGESKTGVARMNRPASYPGTTTANLTGINYKFSQAGWNPRDLSETTLQVLYDPGWSLKWIGSLMICLGIALQFYWRPGDARKPSAQTILSSKTMQ